MKTDSFAIYNNEQSCIEGLRILGIKRVNSKHGIVFISKTGRKYSVQPSGNIRGYSSKSSWLIGRGGLYTFVQKVCNKPGHYLGV